jgi:predicted 2-oxoglutarate/Fe(II)-dependent dioxygenase YbiX
MRFGIGDPVPWFAADTHTTPSFQFSAAAGRLVVLSFVGSLERPEGTALLAELARYRAAFDDERLCFFGVIVDPRDLGEGRATELLPGIRWFQDFSGEHSRAYGALQDAPAEGAAGTAAVYQPFSLLLDERLRVLALIRMRSGEEHLRRLLEVALAMPAPEPAAPALAQAPVLRVPRVFEPEFCRVLIDYYRAQGSEDSGFMRDQGGKTVGVYDYGTKRRRDCNIEDEQLKRQCMLRIHRRLVPEIKRAYQFDATRMERYIVACYQGEHGGHFRAHRDNTTRATAHRKFAVSLNLNDDYDGGCVWFPEYGRGLFRPATGEAVVFSCSILHEATAVTRGTRYVFLPFLYDDAAAKVREQTREFLGGNINAPPEP